MSDALPGSAWELAQQSAELPDPAHLGDEVLALVAAVRRLTAATVAADLDEDRRVEVAAAIDRIAARLEVTARSPVVLVGRHADGRIENLTQAGSGRLNPHAPPVVFDPIELPDTRQGPVAVEVSAEVTLDAAHGGPPGKAHGGVVATILDEVLGTAATVAGASGLTAELRVSFRAAAPLHEPLRVNARWLGSDGRKHRACGEMSRADGTVVADAAALFIAPRDL